MQFVAQNDQNYNFGKYKAVYSSKSLDKQPKVTIMV